MIGSCNSRDLRDDLRDYYVLKDSAHAVGYKALFRVSFSALYRPSRLSDSYNSVKRLSAFVDTESQ